MTFAEHVMSTRSLLKARRAYMRERRWTDEWIAAWQTGLAAEVHAAAREMS